MKCYGYSEDVRPVCLVNTELPAFGYVYRGKGCGAEWIPVDREEGDCAGACGLVILSDNVLKMGGLGDAGPCSSAVYMAWAGGKVEGVDPVCVPIG